MRRDSELNSSIFVARGTRRPEQLYFGSSQADFALRSAIPDHQKVMTS